MFSGRPGSISPEEIDTKFPMPEEFPTDENGVVQKDCRQSNVSSGLMPAKLVRPSCNLEVYSCKEYCLATTRGWQQSETDDIFRSSRSGPNSPHDRPSRKVLSDS